VFEYSFLPSAGFFLRGLYLKFSRRSPLRLPRLGQISPQKAMHLQQKQLHKHAPDQSIKIHLAAKIVIGGAL